MPPINKDRVLRPYSTYLALQYFQTQKYLIDLQEELESKREIKNNKLLSALHKSHEKLPSVFNFKETNTLVLKLHLEVKKKYEKKKFNFKQFQFLEKSYLKQFKEKLSKALVTNTLDTFVKKNPNALGLFFISSIFTISPPQDELDRVLDELKTIK